MKGRRHQQKWILAVAVIVFAGGSPLQAKPIIRPGDRVVFLGDSITAAGHFVSYVEAHLRLQVKGDPVEVINLGLPSEGCTGLSEPDHPFPRPNVHERLARALEKTRPDVVVACYGMNDGIYYPFSQDRFKKYQQGMQQLSRVVKKSGARLILLTPPAFDPLPLKLAGKLLPAGAEKYAWFAIYEDYDDVIKKYADWLASRIEEYDAHVWLLNTGWTGGPYGVGTRFDLAHTRAFVKAILDGTLLGASYIEQAPFGLQVPESVPGVPGEGLDPRSTWEDGDAFDRAAAELAGRFRENDVMFKISDEVRAAGPGG